MIQGLQGNLNILVKGNQQIVACLRISDEFTATRRMAVACAGCRRSAAPKPEGSHLWLLVAVGGGCNTRSVEVAVTPGKVRRFKLLFRFVL